MMILYLLIIGIALIILIIKNKINYWKVRNVKHTTGGLWKATFSLKPFAEDLTDTCNKFENARYIGVYTPSIGHTLFIKDPDLLKQITVKDFDHFPEHRKMVDEESEPLWGKNLFLSRENRWRKLRPTLSPAFTSSKMKMMYVLMKEIAEEFVNYFLAQDEQIVTIDSKDAFTKYTNDVIASTTFGVNCNSFKDPNNEFRTMTAEATNIKGLRLLRFLVGPKTKKLLNIKTLSKQVSSFFRNLVSDTIQLRESKGIIRPDMIHLLMEARKGTIKDDSSTIDTGFATVQEGNILSSTTEKGKIDLTIDEITAQVIIFFLAGFDASSNLMCVMAHELAVNPDIQQRLRNEVDETYDDCSGNITYETLMKMKYLDMVVSETLRKWPPTLISDRLCTKPYIIKATRPHETDLLIEKNTIVGIPIYAIHRDPNNYPDPEKFDPERFNDENKHKIHPYAFIPFGAGPRNCIGSRFALMETKLLFFYILRYFEIEVVDKTPVSMKLCNQFNTVPIGGFWVGLKRRPL